MAFCALFVGGTALGASFGALPAGAAGDAALGQYIVNPGSGWVAVPQNVADEIVSDLQGIESAAAKVTGMTAVVAGNEWRSRQRQILRIAGLA